MLSTVQLPFVRQLTHPSILTHMYRDLTSLKRILDVEGHKKKQKAGPSEQGGLCISSLLKKPTLNVITWCHSTQGRISAELPWLSTKNSTVNPVASLPVKWKCKLLSQRSSVLMTWGNVWWAAKCWCLLSFLSLIRAAHSHTHGTNTSGEFSSAMFHSSLHVMSFPAAHASSESLQGTCKVPYWFGFMERHLERLDSICCSFDFSSWWNVMT